MTASWSGTLRLGNAAGTRLLIGRGRVVLCLVAWSFDNHEIARLEGVSLSTVRTQLHSVRGKLNCPNRTQLVMVAMLSGLVDIDQIVGMWRRHKPELFE